MRTTYRKTIGVLGGLGPDATVDFLAKLSAAAKELGAATDQLQSPQSSKSATMTPESTRVASSTGMQNQNGLMPARRAALSSTSSTP